MENALKNYPIFEGLTNFSYKLQVETENHVRCILKTNFTIGDLLTWKATLYVTAGLTRGYG